MKKILCALTVISLSIFSFSIDRADAVSLNTDGAQVTITAGVTGASDIVFTPSTNVYIRGTSVATSWAAAAWHEQALGKDTGQAYGMAANSSRIAWQNLKTVTAALTFTGTNASAFTSPWNTN